MSLERLEQDVTDIRDQLEEWIGPIDERTSRRHSYATPEAAVIPATKQTDTQQRGFFRFQREVKEMIWSKLTGSWITETPNGDGYHHWEGASFTWPHDASCIYHSEMIDTGIKDKIIQPAWSQRQVFFKDTQIFFDQDYSSDLQKKRTRIYEVIKQLKRKKGAGEMSTPSKPENKTGCRREDLSNTNRGCTAAERVRTWCNIEDELKEGWTCNRKTQRDTALSTSDPRPLMQKEL